ncbi:MAG TPA: GAF domain-containing protein [Chthoniobacterales bacterium]|nr:GAF domain-containing protein [Chthoniobacterales bacterium]
MTQSATRLLSFELPFFQQLPLRELALLLACLLVLATALTVKVQNSFADLILLSGLTLLTTVFFFAFSRASRQLRRAQRAKVSSNLALASSALAEADAIRKVILALTQDLHMDSVLDTVLTALLQLVTFNRAWVLVPEGSSAWIALREKRCPDTGTSRSNLPSLMVEKSTVLERIRSERKSLLIPDVRSEESWIACDGRQEFHSWLGVPLVAGDQLLGVLSVAHSTMEHFSNEDLRRTELLAIAATAAIQNARLFSRAEMCVSELENRLVELEAVRSELKKSNPGRPFFDETIL